MRHHPCQTCLHTTVPAVIGTDALFALAMLGAQLREISCSRVLAPHPAKQPGSWDGIATIEDNRPAAPEPGREMAV